MNDDNAKPPKEYYTKEGDHYKCNLCDYTGPQGNVIRHLKKHKEIKVIRKEYQKQEKATKIEREGNSIFMHTVPSGHTKPIAQSSVALIAWKTKHSLPMAAIEDKMFKNFIAAHPEGVLSTKSMRITEEEIANQIIMKKKEALRGAKISLIIDGGTINEFSYYAIGCARFCPSGNSLRQESLDAIVCNEKSSTENILRIISEMINSFQSDRLIIVSICSDNAKNISTGFINTHMTKSADSTQTDTIRLPYLRIACTIHTINLIINDFVENDSTIGDVIRKLTDISTTLHHMRREKRECIKLVGFPRIQQQRWNSLYGLFQYVSVHYDDIKKEFPNCTVTKEQAIKYEKLLKPHAEAVTLLEMNCANQITVYKVMRDLKNSWLELQNMETYKTETKYLLERYEYHSLYTMDIRISMMAYYLSKGGVYEWREKYCQQDSSTAERRAYQSLIGDTADNLASIWKLDNISRGLEYYLEYVEFKSREFVFPDSNELFNSSLQQHDDKYCDNFTKFIEYTRVLPASEAYSERMFASMRDLVYSNQRSMDSDTIRNELIIKLAKLDPRKTCAKESHSSPLKLYLSHEEEEDSSWNDSLW